MRLREPEVAEAGFFWQREYGVVSFSGRDFQEINEYITNQNERHAESRLNDQLERDMEEHLDR